MNQYRMTKDLVDWMSQHPWKPNNKIRYDGSRRNPLTPAAETCGLYIGIKKRGQGRTSQIAQVDILVEDFTTKTVDLLIEVEPSNSPKKILGEVLPALLADSYTPSRCHGPLNQRQIKDAVFLFVTVVPNKEGSQKRLQLEQLEREIAKRLEFRELNVRTVRFCIGNSETDAVQKCKDQIQALLWNPPAEPTEAGESRVCL